MSTLAPSRAWTPAAVSTSTAAHHRTHLRLDTPQGCRHYLDAQKQADDYIAMVAGLPPDEIERCKKDKNYVRLQNGNWGKGGRSQLPVAGSGAASCTAESHTCGTSAEQAAATEVHLSATEAKASATEPEAPSAHAHASTVEEGTSTTQAQGSSAEGQRVAQLEAQAEAQADAQADAQAEPRAPTVGADKSTAQAQGSTTEGQLEARGEMQAEAQAEPHASTVEAGASSVQVQGTTAQGQPEARVEMDVSIAQATVSTLEAQAEVHASAADAESTIVEARPSMSAALNASADADQLQSRKESAAAHVPIAVVSPLAPQNALEAPLNEASPFAIAMVEQEAEDVQLYEDDDQLSQDTEVGQSQGTPPAAGLQDDQDLGPLHSTQAHDQEGEAQSKVEAQSKGETQPKVAKADAGAADAEAQPQADAEIQAHAEAEAQAQTEDGTQGRAEAQALPPPLHSSSPPPALQPSPEPSAQPQPPSSDHSGGDGGGEGHDRGGGCSGSDGGGDSHSGPLSERQKVEVYLAMKRMRDVRPRRNASMEVHGWELSLSVRSGGNVGDMFAVDPRNGQAVRSMSKLRAVLELPLDPYKPTAHEVIELTDDPNTMRHADALPAHTGSRKQDDKPPRPQQPHPPQQSQQQSQQQQQQPAPDGAEASSSTGASSSASVKAVQRVPSWPAHGLEPGDPRIGTPWESHERACSCVGRRIKLW